MFFDKLDVNEIASWLTIAQLGVILFISLAGLIASRFFWNSRSRRNKHLKTYFPTHHVDFYETFCKEIRNAKSLIRIVGDGFTLSNPSSRRNANTLDAAFYDALKKGVRVERFQISSTAPISWYSRLYAFKKEFPDLFRVFINPNYDGIGSFCIIDPGSRRAVLESQTTTGVIAGRGTEPVFFSFIYGHQSKTNRANNLFSQAKDDECASELKLENIRQVQEREWDRRAALAKSDPQASILDPEIIQALREGSNNALDFPRDKFMGSGYTELNFTDNLCV